MRSGSDFRFKHIPRKSAKERLTDRWCKYFRDKTSILFYREPQSGNRQCLYNQKVPYDFVYSKKRIKIQDQHFECPLYIKRNWRQGKIVRWSFFCIMTSGCSIGKKVGQSLGRWSGADSHHWQGVIMVCLTAVRRLWGPKSSIGKDRWGDLMLQNTGVRWW